MFYLGFDSYKSPFKCGFTLLSIIQVMWPDFSVWSLWSTILEYQRLFPLYEQKRKLFNQIIIESNNEFNNDTTTTGNNERVKQFLVEK